MSVLTVKKPSIMGQRNPRWNGGQITTKDGRVMIYSPNHPNPSKGRYVYRYRLIAEECLGRFLDPANEVVHHINGVVNDDRPENLEVMDRIAHNRYHARSNFHNNKWARKHDWCVQCFTDELPHKGNGLCSKCYEKARVRK